MDNINTSSLMSFDDDNDDEYERQNIVNDLGESKRRCGSYTKTQEEIGISMGGYLMEGKQVAKKERNEGRLKQSGETSLTEVRLGLSLQEQARF